jgi:hypothetical protein
MAKRKNASALAVSRRSRSRISTTTPYFVDRTIEIPLLSFAEQEHFVHEPPVADWAPTTADLGGQLRPEGPDPVQDRPV